MTASPNVERSQDATVEDVLHLEPYGRFNGEWYRFSSLVSWLVASTRPAVTVEMGPMDPASILATGEAIHKADSEATCVAVLLSETTPGESDDGTRFRDLLAEVTDRFGNVIEGFETEEAALTTLPDRAKIDLLHLALFDCNDMDLPDFDAWFGAMAPGATVVVTTTRADASSNFAKAKQRVSDQFPSVSLSLGSSSEAVVGQVPAPGGTPVVERLQNASFAVGSLLVLFAEHELQSLLGDEHASALGVGAFIGRLLEQQHAEREVFETAVRVHREQAAHLAVELSDSKRTLAHQIETARLEREHLVEEFLDRLDVLSAKISTSASRYRSELADKERLLEALDRRIEDYAGQAAIAQSLLDDMRSSSSWRFTAPIRLISRVLARRRSATASAPGE